MRVLASVFALIALVSVSSGSAAPQQTCPRDAALGTVSFPRAGHEHVVSLASCADHVAGRASTGRPTLRSPDGRYVASVRNRSRQDGEADDLGHRHGNRSAPSGVLGDRVLQGDRPRRDAGPHRAPPLLGRRPLGVLHDRPGLCGVDRGRRSRPAGRVGDGWVLIAAPPDWRPRALLDDRNLSFATPACTPDGRAVAVLAQRSSVVATFFATRWRLWRVGLDGSRRLLDTPPPGWADAAPQWSRDGRSLLFMRERNGYGRIMLLRDGTVYGPIVSLGYNLGFYGHHDREIVWRR